jgi:hypothetical protein
MYGYSLEEKIKEVEHETNPERKEKLLKEIKMSKLNYETQLFPDNKGNIDIKMILKSDVEKLKIKDRNVILRGKLNPEGEILSFYYNQNKKNLISLFFELPKKPVKIGDEWNIDVNIISMDQHFKADSLFKENKVILKNIVKRNGENIAIIEYDLTEYVSGSLDNKKIDNSKNGERTEKPYMKASHKITGEFNIDKGIWMGYDGYREIESNISIWGSNNNGKSVLKLILQK